MSPSYGEMSAEERAAWVREQAARIAGDPEYAWTPEMEQDYLTRSQAARDATDAAYDARRAARSQFLQRHRDLEQPVASQ